MKDVVLSIPEEEARRLYSLIHGLANGQDDFLECYQQLQGYFFQVLTIDEVRALLHGNSK